MLENARKLLEIFACSTRKLLEIFTTWLSLALIFLENELLENTRLEFYFPFSKSPSEDKSIV